jgi:6-phosphofructokinase 1
MGSHAVELVEADQWGRMVAVQKGRITSVPLADVCGAPPRTVHIQGSLVRAARGMGIVFGDEKK